MGGGEFLINTSRGTYKHMFLEFLELEAIVCSVSSQIHVANYLQ